MSAFILRHNPTAAMLSSWFDRMLGDPSAEADQELTYRLQPRMDISEEENQYFISMDVPGLTKADIGIKVENGTLKIEGERKDERKGKHHHSERAYGKFLRSFSLPDDVDSAKIEAKAENGVLELKLPKNKKALPIEIRVS